MPQRNVGHHSVQFSCSVVSDSLRPHESQQARPPCPSATPGVHSDSRPLSPWCHPAISSSVIPFSSCPQSLPGSVFSNKHTNISTIRVTKWGRQDKGIGNIFKETMAENVPNLMEKKNLLGKASDLEKEMATHSSVLVWRITGTGGLPSLWSHRVGHDWSDLAAKHLTAMHKTPVQSIGQEDLLEKG